MQIPHPHATRDIPNDATPEPNAGALRLIAMVATGAAAYALSPILTPLLLAIVFSIALAPVANRLERFGLNATIASILCVLTVALTLAGIGALVVNQAGAILQRSDEYVDRLGDTIARGVRTVGAEKWIGSLSEDGAVESAGKTDAGDALVSKARAAIRTDAREVGRWALSGVNGAIKFAGDTILFLAFLFYMLQGRRDWVERLRKAAIGLGMRPRHKEFARVAGELKTYIGTLAIVSTIYFVVISAALWMIGIPQPLLWGMLTAILELVPFFGPVIAGTLPAIVALGTGKPWQPLAVIALFLTLEMVEGYVIAPLLYGKAVEIEPVTVILGVLFFGWLLGPAGLALAMPMMILLRGILVITPDTPALDALADTKEVEQ